MTASPRGSCSSCWSSQPVISDKRARSRHERHSQPRSRGFALATALHAPGIDEAFSVICEGNDVPDAHAGRLDLAVYIRSLGDDWRNPERRVIAEVREIDSVKGGSPQGRTLFLWDEEADRFEAHERPKIIGSEVGGLEERVKAFARAASGA